MASLSKAVIDFPPKCTGDISEYFLWPYEDA
jgi:hypothetical protein